MATAPNTQKTPQKRIGIYLRISQDREGMHETTERHRKECGATARKLPGHIVETFIDNDREASTGKPRPAYERMLTWIEEHRLDTIVAWHADRLHRRPVELERYIDICQPRGVATYFVQAAPFDLTTASGRMIARQLGVMARYETEHFIERLKSKQADAAAKGQWMGGTRPFGWGIPTGAVRKNGTPIYNMYKIVPEEADELRRLTRAVIAGESLGVLIRDLNDRGIQSTGSYPRNPDGTRKPGHPPWTHTSLKQVLTRKRNIGVLEYHGHTYKGQWPAIVDEDEFHACCAILADPTRRTTTISNATKWLGAGIFRCGVDGCGERLRSGWATKPSRRIYRCPRGKGHVHRNAEPIDALIQGGTINGEYTEGAVVLRLRSADTKKLMRPVPDSGIDAKALRAERELLRARLVEADDMLGSLEWDRARHRRQSARITTRLDEITGLLEPAPTNDLLHSLAAAVDPQKEWETINLQGRRLTVEQLMTVTVHTVGRGFHSRIFDPATVTITFKRV